MMRLFKYKIEALDYNGNLFDAEGITFGETPADAFARVWKDYHIDKKDEKEEENVWSLTIEENFMEDYNTYELKRKEEDE